MSEPSISEDIKATRAQVAEQIYANRRIDRAGLMTTSRTGDEYIHFLGGLQATADYARGLSGKKWLDIGAGTTQGVNELSKTSLAEGLQVEATVLHRGTEVEQYLGRAKTHITPAETLRQIPDASVSLVTALNSVAYSVAPRMTVSSIDRVLEEGGVFQGTFQDPKKAHILVDMHSYDEFKRVFDERGYDTAVAINPDLESGVYILIAVKKGGAISATELLKKNLETLPPAPTEAEKEAEAKLGRGFGMGLDLLGQHPTPDQIEAFVENELKGVQEFSPQEADLVRERLLERFSR